MCKKLTPGCYRVPKFGQTKKMGSILLDPLCETKFQKAIVGRQFTDNKLSAESGVRVEKSSNVIIQNINDVFIRSVIFGALIIGAALGGALVYYICIIDFQKRAKLKADLQRENDEQKMLKDRQGIPCWKFFTQI